MPLYCMITALACYCEELFSCNVDSQHEKDRLQPLLEMQSTVISQLITNGVSLVAGSTDISKMKD